MDLKSSPGPLCRRAPWPIALSHSINVIAFTSKSSHLSFTLKRTVLEEQRRTLSSPLNLLLRILNTLLAPMPSILFCEVVISRPRHVGVIGHRVVIPQRPCAWPLRLSSPMCLVLRSEPTSDPPLPKPRCHESKMAQRKLAMIDRPASVIVKEIGGLVRTESNVLVPSHCMTVRLRHIA